jgi:mRNA interferase MazF
MVMAERSEKNSISPGVEILSGQTLILQPVTSRVRGHGFEVALTGEKISGVVLCHQVKAIDFVERGLKFVEKSPASVVSETLAKVRAILTE